MPVSSSRQSYQDCFQLFDAALADPLGARVLCGEWNAASKFRLRMHYARTIDRNDNKRIYDKAHPMWGASVYDPLTVKLKQDTEDQWWAYVEKGSEADLSTIQGLSEEEPINGR